MGKTRERQIVVKTDRRLLILELGDAGKFQVKSSGWDENRVFLEAMFLKLRYAMAGRPAREADAMTFGEHPDRAARLYGTARSSYVGAGRDQAHARSRLATAVDVGATGRGSQGPARHIDAVM